MAALRETLAAIPDDIPVIGDAKRGDIGNTAKAYARALFDELGFDAATVNPYLGGDAVEPFLEREEKAAFILCRTSNPGARDFQDLAVSDRRRVAAAVRGRRGDGATLEHARQRRPRRRRDVSRRSCGACASSARR